jgi:predicted nucleotidyltransferase
MPVKLSNSSLLKRPDLETVRQSLSDWVEDQRRKKPELLRAGYFGSYAREDWGVGSDLDVILIVRDSHTPFLQRALEWDLLGLPVPVDLVVYMRDEWEKMVEQGEHFSNIVEKEAIWLF